MTRLSLPPKVAALAFAAVLALASRAQASPIVVPTVTPAGPLLHYNYSITNDQAVDLLEVSIKVRPADLSLTNLFAPPGFQAIYDSGLGLVAFLPSFNSVAVFGALTTLTGFGFDSLFGPAASVFDTLTANGDLLSGPTIAPVGRAAVPEPDTATLLMTALVLLLADTVRRRRLTASI